MLAQIRFSSLDRYLKSIAQENEFQISLVTINNFYCYQKPQDQIYRTLPSSCFTINQMYSMMQYQSSNMAVKAEKSSHRRRKDLKQQNCGFREEC